MSDQSANIEKLVRNFRTHIKAYKSKDTKEAEIRQQFIDPFWRALGWDVGDTKGVGPIESEVIIEKNVETVEVGGLRTRRPDFMFRLGGLDRFILEAKKPAIDIDVDKDATFQTKVYTYSKGLPFAVLTNFEQFRLYDTSAAPDYNASKHGLVPEFARFDDLFDGVTQCATLDARGSAEGVVVFDAPMPSGEGPWRFMAPAFDKVYKTVSDAATMTLDDAADRLFQGVRTSKNEVFVLRVSDAKRHMYFSEELGRQVELEPGLLKPFLDGDKIRRYAVEPTEAVAIFPYGKPRAKGGVDLVAASEIKKMYPKTWGYLEACEKTLRAREGGAMDTDAGYAYGRTQNLDLFGIPRVLVPDMMDTAAFALDEEGEAAFVSGYGIILKPDYQEDMAYFTGLLNSTLISGFLKSVSTTMRGGWYRTFPQFLRQIPIKLPKTAEDKKLAERIVVSVRAIMDAKAALSAPVLSDREKNQHQSVVEANEARINESVFGLYGVKGLPGD